LFLCEGGPSLLDQLMADQTLTKNKNAKEGLEDMGLLFVLLKAYKVLDRVSSYFLSFSIGVDFRLSGFLRSVACERS
jgi:histidyl-tRNA synthetase